MAPWLDLAVAGMLLVLATGLAYFERRNRTVNAEADNASRLYLERRFRRRIKVAILLMLLAATIVGARWIDADRRPVPYLLAWLAAALLTLWLMWLGIVDYIAARLHWVGRTQRNLVDIARTRAELRELQSRGRNGRSHDH